MTTKPATAPDRKALARDLAAEIGAETKYLGAPSFAYKVGPYTINKDASIDGEDLEAIRAFLIRHDYIHQEPAYEADEEDANSEAERLMEETVNDTEAVNTPEEPEESLSETGPADSEEDVIEQEPEESNSEDAETKVSVPISDMNPAGLVNLIRLIYAKQNLINAMLQSDFISIDEEVIDLLNDEKPDSAEAISEILQSEGDIGMFRGLDLKDGCASFIFPFNSSDPTHYTSFAKLLTALIGRARKAQRVNAKRIEPAEGEMKYYCNSMLAQLGFGGPDFKADRAALLGHLTGYAAFRSEEKMREFSERRKAAANAPADLEADSGEVAE